MQPLPYPRLCAKFLWAIAPFPGARAVRGVGAEAQRFSRRVHSRLRGRFIVLRASALICYQKGAVGPPETVWKMDKVAQLPPLPLRNYCV